jgi:hypothetical protein
MTLAKAWVDLKQAAFAHGALNVALSRVRRLEDLFMFGVLDLEELSIAANDDIQDAAMDARTRAANQIFDWGDIDSEFDEDANDERFQAVDPEAAAELWEDVPDEVVEAPPRPSQEVLAAFQANPV